MQSLEDEKTLIAKTRPFAVESKPRSWLLLLSTYAFVAVALVLAFQTPSTFGGWILRVFASGLAGFLTVRAFILYHDFLHGALLRNSKIAKGLFWFYGLLIMTPPKVWRETHNYHHANTAKIVGSHVGSYMMVTTTIWAKMSPRERAMYKIIRHPLTIAFGYFTLFMFGMGVAPFLRQPKKHWASLASVLLNWALSIFLIAHYGLATFFFVLLLPLGIATAVGGYLFYAQHNFPDIHVQSREEWSFGRAALESSSFMEMGPIMRFFCGNIGYHHVHHLNAMIPFYRLPEAMAAIPELHHPPKTSLRPSAIAACLRLKLWDSELQKMVGYP